MTKFKYSVIGDNTPENIEHLRILGYKIYGKYIGDTLCVGFDGLYQVKKYKLERTSFNVFLDLIKPIDCRGNDELFRAVSAIRDGSDYMQWFTCKTSEFTESWYLCEEESYVPWAKKKNPFLNSLVFSHKATLEELKEHFKK